MDPDTEIELDISPAFRVYKSGRIERLFGTDVVPASVDTATGVASKDITIDPSTAVSARLYLPANPNPKEKLPVLLYFHGGGFCVESPFSPAYHPYLNALVSQAYVLAVSVHYRRAPEHPVPAAHLDSFAALRWVLSASNPWVAEHGDLERLFLAGDSAGSNLAHHVAMRAAAEGLSPRIAGVALVHPFFWGSSPAGPEEAKNAERRASIERLWRAVSGKEVDDPVINPVTGAGALGLQGLGCRRLLVCVAEKDLLRERGVAYYEALKGSGWGGEVELWETKGEDHVYHLQRPESEKAVALMEKLAAFFNGE